MKTKVLIFKDEKGNAPLVEWLAEQPTKARIKCIAKIARLGLMGHELRRPDCDYLTESVYELRVRDGNLNYRILYGFVGKNVALLSHGCTKKKRVPEKEINCAVKNIALFRKNSEKYSLEFEV